MRRVTFLFPVFICLLLMLTPAVAQEDGGGTPEDLLSALLLTPDIPESRSWFSYVDFRGMEYGRFGATRPESLAALDDDESVGIELWWSALRGIQNGPIELLEYFQMIGNLPETVGMDFVEIEQAVDWGNPPQKGTLFLGDFDEEAIAAAYINREYSASEINGFTVWCNDDVGCEGGAETDLQGRRPEIPFGGALGQRQPLLVLDDGILSSSQYELLETTAGIESRDVRSLGHAAEYQVIVEALDETSVVIQALIMPPDDFLNSSIEVFRRLEADEREVVYNNLAETALVQPLPAYQLIALVGQASEGAEEVQVMLVYDSAEDAESAAEVIPARIREYESLRNMLPFTELLEEREASFDTFVYTSEEVDKSVLVVTFSGPLPPALPINGQFEISGRLYRTFINMIYTLDTGWLSTGLPPLEEIEAVLENEG